MTIKRNSILILMIIFISNICHAQPHFQFQVIPFVWNSNMNGRVQISFKKEHVDRNQPSGMMFMQFNIDRLGIFINPLYSEMNEEINRGWYDVEVQNKFGIITGGIAYELCTYPIPNMKPENVVRLEPYVGLRYTIKNTDMTVSSFFINTTFSHHVNWTDPIAGLRFHYNFSRDLALSLAGDIGGTSTERDYSYEAIGLIAYHTHNLYPRISFYLGYQIIDQRYVEGRNDDYFNWNTKLSGPLAGIGITF